MISLSLSSFTIFFGLATFPLIDGSESASFSEAIWLTGFFKSSAPSVDCSPEVSIADDANLLVINFSASSLSSLSSLAADEAAMLDGSKSRTGIFVLTLTSFSGRPTVPSSEDMIISQLPRNNR